MKYLICPIERYILETSLEVFGRKGIMKPLQRISLSLLLIGLLLVSSLIVPIQSSSEDTPHATGAICYSGDTSLPQGIPGEEELDQVQQQYNHYRFAIRSSLWAAQSFIPTLPILSKVELLIGKGGFPPSHLKVSIRETLQGEDLTSTLLSPSDIRYGLHWKEVDLPDCELEPWSTYYLVLNTTYGTVSNCYIWGFGYNTSYDQGCLFYSGSTGVSWNKFLQYDFCFKTFGYTPPPPNQPPDEPTNPIPAPDAQDVPRPVSLKVSVSDPDDDSLTVEFINATDHSIIDALQDVPSGTSPSITWPDLSPNTTYHWYVLVNDSQAETQSQTWSFTTSILPENQPPDQPSSPTPAPNAINVTLNPQLGVIVTDPDDDLLTVSFYNASNDELIETRSDIQNGAEAAIIWSDLHYNTTYEWYVLVNDSHYITSSPTWTFTTMAKPINHPPEIPFDPEPLDGAMGLSLNVFLAVNVSDPDDDLLTVTFFDAASSIPLEILSDIASGSRVSCPWTDLIANTTYHWYVVVNDSFVNTTSPSWSFTTKNHTVNIPPDQPIDPQPSDGALRVNQTPHLSVTVSDPDNDLLTVCFYEATQHTIIAEIPLVASGSRITTIWNGLSPGTTYQWYVTVNDSFATNTSSIWSFTTASLPENHPPDVPSHPDPADNATNVGLQADLWWSGDDPDGDTVTYDVYFEADNPTPSILVSHQQYSTHYDPGIMKNDTVYYWKIIAWDEHDEFTEGPIWNFTTKTSQTNHPPDKPTDPTPANGATGISTSPILKVKISDPDGDALSARFFNAANDEEIGNYSYLQQNTTVELLWPGLAKGTTYSWYVIVNDTLLENTSATWHFTTEEPTPVGPSNGGGSSSGGGQVVTQPPVADASAGEPYVGFTGEPILFDGSNSYDPDGGAITSWQWNFGDTTGGSGETITHTYTSPGTYTVWLTVTDEDGLTDTTETYAEIQQPNLPPSKPIIIGPSTGHINHIYNYTIVADDPDGDNLTIMINWDDGTTTTMSNITSSSEVLANHTWVNAAPYTITVDAIDTYNALSEAATLQVLIDVMLINDTIHGYLIDINDDGVYDLYHNDTSGLETNVFHQDDGNYLIDDDGDGLWDWLFDPTTHTLTAYVYEEEEGLPFGYVLTIVVVIILLILILLVVATRKKEQKETPPESEKQTAKPEEEPKEPKKEPVQEEEKPATTSTKEDQTPTATTSQKQAKKKPQSSKKSTSKSSTTQKKKSSSPKKKTPAKKTSTKKKK
jgi:preprotein translocase subunit SecG